VPNEPGHDEERWLLEPPRANEVQIHVATGEGAQVSPEIVQDLERLISRLQSADADVEGFRTLPPCGELETCSTFDCTLGKCVPLSNKPCLANIKCRIESIRLY